MKIDLKSFQSAMSAMSQMVEEDISLQRDFGNVLTSSQGENFILVLIPSRDNKYTDAIIDLMNAEN